MGAFRFASICRAEERVASMAEDKLMDRAKDLSKHVLLFGRKLKGTGVEGFLINQLQRAGTSVFANVNEAHAAQRRKDFAAKLHVALKECKECDGWFGILHESDSISEEDYLFFHNKCIEICRILSHSIQTAKRNLDNQ